MDSGEVMASATRIFLDWSAYDWSEARGGGIDAGPWGIGKIQQNGAGKNEAVSNAAP